MIFHIHRFGPIKDGYQYCIKCQKAFPVEHKCLWEEVEARTITTEDFRRPDLEKRVTAEIKILKCHICGDLKEFRISI